MYENLKSYQNSILVHDFTVRFIDRYIPKNSRTCDQMTQAARSGKQNISEGSSHYQEKPKSEITLHSVSSASLKELLEDYKDYLRQHNLRQWPKNDPRALKVRGLYKLYPPYPSYPTNKTDPSYPTYKTDKTYKSYPSDKTDPSYKPDKPYPSDKPDRPYPTNKPYNPYASDRPHPTDKPYPSDKPDRPYPTNKPYNPYASDKPHPTDKSYPSYKTDPSYPTNKPDKPYMPQTSGEWAKQTLKLYEPYLDNPEAASNAMICLINQTTYLLDNQIRAIKKQLENKGISLESKEQRTRRTMNEAAAKEKKFEKEILAESPEVYKMFYGKYPHEDN